jgi:hypothetical protein
VSAGIARPTGGGSFCYAMNALTATPGAVGLYATPQAPNTNFNPLLKGCDVRGAVQRGIANGNTGYSAFIFALLQGTTVNDTGYLLGLSDGDPSHIELRKGILATGLPDEAPGGVNKILQRSSGTVAPGTWVHLRLEAVVNLNGDVVLNCFQNLGNVTTPAWVAIAGISQYIDDAVGVNSGSLPYLGGRAGFGGTFNGVTRRSFFDHMELVKQT